MLVQVKRANITNEEAQKNVDRFTYLISLGMKKFCENGGDISILDSRKDMTFSQWYDYINSIKDK